MDFKSYFHNTFLEELYGGKWRHLSAVSFLYTLRVPAGGSSFDFEPFEAMEFFLSRPAMPVYSYCMYSKSMPAADILEETLSLEYYEGAYTSQTDHDVFQASLFPESLAQTTCSPSDTLTGDPAVKMTKHEGIRRGIRPPNAIWLLI